MWLTCLIILLAILAFMWWTAGPNRAAAVAVLLSLLVPSWITQEFFDFPITIPVAVGMAALGAYCVHPRAVFRARLGLIDWAILSLFVVHMCSDWSQQGFSWSVPLRAYGEWYVPYVTGRIAIRNADDFRALMPIMVFAVIWLSVVSIVQGLTGIDLAETVFGSGQVDAHAREMSRWGFHRAFGPLKNPNYFGVLQLLLFPWSVYAAANAWNRRGPGWWLILPLLTAVGVFFPMSRASWVGLLISIVLVWLLTQTRWRVTLPVLFVTIAALIAWKSALIIDLLDAANTGDLNALSDNNVASETKIKIGEEKVRYTNTLNRVYLIRIYGTAIQRGGLLGFGTEAVTGFPINVPIGQQDLETLKTIWTVDNAYLLIGLRFGYLGLVSFVVWCLSIAITWGQIAVSESLAPDLKAFTGTMAGVTAAIIFVLLTVWMPQDFGFWYIWTAGSCAGLKEGLNRTQTFPTVMKRRAAPAVTAGFR